MAKKNQLIISLGNINLTDEQRSNIQMAIHDLMAKKVKAIKNTNAPVVSSAITATSKKTAKISVTFSKVSIGNSELTATFKSKAQKINQSDIIIVDGLERGDEIGIDGTSNGNTTITIDIDAKPASMSFGPGNFNDNFLIN